MVHNNYIVLGRPPKQLQYIARTSEVLVEVLQAVHFTEVYLRLEMVGNEKTSTVHSHRSYVYKLTCSCEVEASAGERIRSLENN